MATAFNKVAPVFRIYSEKKAREFYLGFLGCKVDWEHRSEPEAPLCMQVSRNGLVITSASTTATARRAPSLMSI